MGEAGVGGDVKAVFWLTAALMVAAALIDSGAVGWLVAPVALSGLIYCAARAPLRNSLMVFLFCALTIDYPTETFGTGLFRTPLFSIGTVLFEHLNIITGIKALFFSGSDILLAVLGVVALLRESSGSRIDRFERVPTPRPQVRMALIALAGAGYVWVGGLVRGGDFSMSLWQLQRVIYLPILFLLCHLGFRGPKDHIALGKLLLTAGVIRAVMAVYVKHTVIPPTDPGTGLAVLQTATTHGDSMLFASAFVLLILMVVERAGKRPVRLALLLLPILVWGMASNNRRLVWVHVALILITLYLVMPDNNFKRKFRRLIYYSLPAIGLYMIAGWNSEYGRLFKPVRIARSIIEPQSDGSSLWRELENFNLIVTVKQSPIIGFGYGHKFIEAIPLPAVNYSLEYYCPHNSLLGLWAFAGFIGYTAITMMWGVGVYFAMRGYHNAKDPRDRVAAVLSVGAVLVYLVQAFGDIGLGSLTGISLLAPALAIAGKLAVATGSWGATRQPAAAQPAPPGGAPPHPLGRPQLAPAGRGRVR